MLSDRMPPVLEVTEELIAKCRDAGSYNGPLFELYKSTGHACFLTAEDIVEGGQQGFPANAVLGGLLTRCARLVLANVHLTHQDQFGEAAAILDRCLAESCTNVRWICQENTPERLAMFLADGMKKDLMLRGLIQKYVEKNDGEVKLIEDRMLRSVQATLDASRMTEGEVRATERLPSYEQRTKDLGLIPDFYMAFQRMGSGAVHGNWQNLLCFYLRDDGDGGFSIRDHPCSPRPDQYAVLALYLLETLGIAAAHSFSDSTLVDDAISVYRSIHEQIFLVYNELLAPDAETVRC